MFLGIDLGTSSVKVLVLDDEGRAIARASAAHPMRSPRPGWHESDPADWWRAVIGAVSALEEPARRSVRAIGLSGQMHTVVATDADGKPLRPAILWLDHRASGCLADLHPETESRTGNPPASGMTATSLAWLRRHEPVVFRSAVRWLQPKDWLRLHLTGDAAATDPSDASGTLLASLVGGWDATLLDHLGIAPGRMPDIVPSGACVSRLEAESAAALGLPQGLPLVAGAADTAAAALGSGLVRPGQCQLTLGTGAQCVRLASAAEPDLSPRNQYRTAVSEPYAPWYQLAPILNAGSALDWARTLLGVTWDEAFRAAESAVEDALVFLPDLAPERIRNDAIVVGGAWIGLSRGTDRAALMRAAFEGVTVGLAEGCRLAWGTKPPDMLRVAGGGSRNAWWRQSIADALGVRLERIEDSDASARGAALLAGVGVGHWNQADVARLEPAVLDVTEPAADRSRWQVREARYRALRSGLGARSALDR